MRGELPQIEIGCRHWVRNRSVEVSFIQRGRSSYLSCERFPHERASEYARLNSIVVAQECVSQLSHHQGRAHLTVDVFA
jgi:hypothetical protein